MSKKHVKIVRSATLFCDTLKKSLIFNNLPQCFKTIVKGYTKISSKAKNVTLKAAPSNVRSAAFDIFLDIFLLNVTKIALSFYFNRD